MNKKWLAALYFGANLLFIAVIAGHWFQLRELPDVLIHYARYRKNEATGIDKVIAQGLFYALGSGLSLVVLVNLSRRTGIHKRWLLVCGIYFLAFILLELPLYNQHFGWADSHGHSFWDGVHFH